MSFEEIHATLAWESLAEKIYGASPADVERVLAKEHRNVADFLTLISPSAEYYLEEMAAQSAALTQKRFGKTVQMYIPLYLSNRCSNVCTYCGFSVTNRIDRIVLNEEQILTEARAIKNLGYDHILLVAGEDKREVGVQYFENSIKLLRPLFSNISLEVQPLEQEEYKRLQCAGLHTVLVYQETYRKEHYRDFHPKGKKSNFEYRLATPERLGRAGIHKIGLGVLLGLEDWRIDSAFVAHHLEYLKRAFWRTKFSISFPRLRPAAGVIAPSTMMSDAQLLQLICAYRLLDENLELSLSTRESPSFRDHVFKLGITSISAGSKTEPGGYAVRLHALEQFEVADERSAAEVAAVIAAAGYEPVWKDWDHALE